MDAGKVFETSGLDKLFQKGREDNWRFACCCTWKRLITSRVLSVNRALQKDGIQWYLHSVVHKMKIPRHVETVLLVNKLCSVYSDKACYREKKQFEQGSQNEINTFLIYKFFFPARDWSKRFTEHTLVQINLRISAGISAHIHKMKTIEGLLACSKTIANVLK